MDKFVADGKTITITAGGTVTAGDVDVIGTGLVGVAQNSGVSGDSIVYAIEGVYRLAKITGAIAAGDILDWDVSGAAVGKAITPAAGDVEDFGVAMEAAASGATTVAVKLCPGNGSLN